MNKNLKCNCDDNSQYFCPIHYGAKKYLDNRKMQDTYPVVHETVVFDETVEKRLNNHRANMTAAEKKMFSILVDLHVDFNFDWYIYPYYVDFILWNFALVIELDGSSHNNREEYDDKRSKFIESLGFDVRRIENKDVSKTRVVDILLTANPVQKSQTVSIIDNHNKICYADKKLF